MDWWKLVEENWDNLLKLVKKFHPNDGRYDENYRITAPGAEVLCEKMRKNIREHGPTDPVELAILSKEKRDAATLHSIFQDVWFGMPESSDVRREPGFFVLCDLCGEFPND